MWLYGSFGRSLPRQSRGRRRQRVADYTDNQDVDKGNDSEPYKVAKALVGLARPTAKSFTQHYDSDLKYFLGENHWPTISSWSKSTNDAWKNRSVRNYLYATVRHKAAVCLDAEPSYHVDAIGQPIDLSTRRKIAAVMEDEAARLKMREVKEDAFLRGAPCGVGGFMIRLEEDKLSGEKRVVLDEMDMKRFYPDPGYTRPNRWRFACYEPYLDLSIIKEVFPERGALVQPKPGVKVGEYSQEDRRSKTTEELVTGPGGDLAINPEDGTISQRGADVCMVWLKDEGLAETLLQKTIRPAEMVATCPQCSSMQRPDVGTMGMQTCESCGYSGQDFPVQEKPAETQDFTVVERAYPYGRFIAYSGDVLLADKPNPFPLGPEDIYPFSFYVHDRIAGRFWGYGDVPLGKSIQMAIDKNAAQAIDALRLTFNGPFEYPAEAEGYTNLGNAPGQLVPVALPYMNKARYITPQATNIALFQVVEETLQRDMQRVLGVSDVSVGLSPTAPTSGVEVQARQRAASTRIGQHLKAINDFESNMMTKLYRIMRTLPGPRMVTTQTPMGESEAIALEMAELPPNVAIRVEANIDAIQKEENAGQNLVMALKDPTILQSPFFDFIVSVITKDPAMAEEAMERRNEYMAAMQNQPPQPPPPTPSSSSQIIVALSDLVKAGVPIAHNQIEAALVDAGLPPGDPTQIITPPPQPKPAQANGHDIQLGPGG